METTAEIRTDSPRRPLPTPDSIAVPLCADLPVTVLEPKPGWRFVDFAEVWRYRELLFFLTWRDIKVRYKQTVLGVTWALLQPLATMVVFTLFLGGLAQVPSQRITGSPEVPYPLFVYAGLLPWLFFATAVGSAGQSLVGNQNLITKVYFPRLLIPMGAVGVGVVDFIISFILLVGMMLFFGVLPGWGILWLPVVCIALLFAALGVGMLLSALTVAYRDFRHVLPFLVQLWMFATPSIYMQTDEVLNPRWHKVLPLNPIFGLVDGFRATMLNDDIDFYALGISGAVSVLLFVLGCIYFRRVERNFADII